MDSSTPRPTPVPCTRVDDEQLRRWLRLRRELIELHAKLEYLKLMISLGVTR